MLIRDFPEYTLKTDFLSLVEAELNNMKNHMKTSKEVKTVDDALDLLEFMKAWTENRHSAEGIEDVKQTFNKESSSTREAISKAGLIKEIGAQ